MKKVCVITGGGSGVGLAIAEALKDQDYHVILVGRTVAKLENAVKRLSDKGISAEAYACDLADCKKTRSLAEYAAEVGEVMAVVHAAGLSPHMGEEKVIMEGNAQGTVNIHNAFYGMIGEGGCLIDTSSMSAHLTPQFIMPKKAYPLSQENSVKFMKKMMARVNLFPKGSRPGVAYSISKHFVIWYAKAEAARFGEQGVRVLCVTPGNFETPMGELEKEEAGAYLKYNAIKRFGKPEEIARLYVALMDERIGYLTGAEILCDGGCIAGGAKAVRS